MLVSVTVYLKGEQLIPEYVTGILEVRPSETARKGHPHAGFSTVARTGLWMVASDEEVESSILNDHIQNLMTRMNGCWKRIKDIEDIQEAYVDVFISLSDEESAGHGLNFELSEKQMDALQKSNLPVRFAFSF